MKLYEENWLPVVGYEGMYEVSDLGKVKSLDRTEKTKNKWGEFKRKRAGKILSQRTSNCGYKRVELNNHEHSVRSVHVLVLEAFIGVRPYQYVACHNNGDKANNELINLRWDTSTNNELDKEKHGTRRLGSQLHNAKLSEEAVWFIRYFLTKGMTSKALAELFMVSKSTICAIKNGRLWKHVLL